MHRALRLIALLTVLAIPAVIATADLPPPGTPAAAPDATPDATPAATPTPTHGTKPASAEPPVKPLPDVLGRTPEGEILVLSKLRVQGQAPRGFVLLFTVGEACAPCTRQAEEFARQAQGLSPQGIAALAVFEDAETATVVAGSKPLKDAAIPIVHDRFQALAERLGIVRNRVFALPACVVLDGSRHVKAMTLGGPGCAEEARRVLGDGPDSPARP